jgi:hypothetical protein
MTFIVQRRAILLGLAALLATPFSVTHAIAQQLPAAAQPDPLNAVKLLYDPRIKEEQRPYSRRLRALYAAAIRKSKQVNEPVAGLDFEPTIGGQDYDDDFRKTLRYKTVSQNADKAVIEATLRAFKTEKPVTITYELVFENNAWRINDIANLVKTDGWRLSTLLIAGAKGQ